MNLSGSRPGQLAGSRPAGTGPAGKDKPVLIYDSWWRSRRPAGAGSRISSSCLRSVDQLPDSTVYNSINTIQGPAGPRRRFQGGVKGPLDLV